MGATGYARFASIRAQGAGLTPKHDPSKKIEIDWAEALGGGRFFFFNQQPTIRWRSRWWGILGRVRDSGGTRGGGVVSSFGVMA